MLNVCDLFESRTHGYHTYRIPCIVTTPEDTVLVTCEARPGKGGDYDFNDVLIRRSTDGGRTFEPFAKLIDHADYGAGPVSNVVMIADHQANRVVMVFCHDYATVFTMQSDDDGLTWSKPREITAVMDQFKDEYPWRVCATGPGHGIQLRNGRFIVPVWLSDSSLGEFGPAHRGHRPNLVATIFSEDGGKTWERGRIAARYGGTSQTGMELGNCNEAQAVELAGGHVMLNIRCASSADRRLTAVSPDGAHDWSTPRFDGALLEPVCHASLIRHPSGKLIFTNPDNLENKLIPAGGLLKHDRKRLTAKLSVDDGASWPVSRVIEPGPSAYSDLACLADGTVLCFYECGMLTHMCDNRTLRLARFDLNWLYNRDPP